VLVTGASRGIGRAVAIALASRGARVGVHYQSDRSGAEATLHSMSGQEHASFRANLEESAAIEQLWLEATRTLGRIDCVVNNAGIYPDHPLFTSDYATWTALWHRTVSVNLLGPAHLSFLAARSMAAMGGGRIVNVSSRAAFRGEPTAPAYAASKAGLNAFSQSLAKAMAPHGVHVFVVAPGWVDTDRVAAAVQSAAVLADQPLGRVAAPEEVAEVIAFCALDAPASMTGAIVDVNGASYLRT
jgi:NAD(P)-dependent dehydrogenase (short-subunit alcohol dehydrogenase family)